MKHVTKTRNNKTSSKALQRLREIEQTLSTMEWEARLRQLHQAIVVRQTLLKIIRDESIDIDKEPAKGSSVANSNQPSQKRYSLPGISKTLQIHFQIAAPQLRPHPITTSVFRGASRSGDSLLFNDVLTSDNAPVFVQAWLGRAPQQDSYDVRLIVKAASGVLKHSRVQLKWGKHAYTKSLARTKTVFRIANPDFSQDMTLTLSLPSQAL